MLSRVNKNKELYVTIKIECMDIQKELDHYNYRKTKFARIIRVVIDALYTIIIGILGSWIYDLIKFWLGAQ